MLFRSEELESCVDWVTTKEQVGPWSTKEIYRVDRLFLIVLDRDSRWLRLALAHLGESLKLCADLEKSRMVQATKDSYLPLKPIDSFIDPD